MAKSTTKAPSLNAIHLILQGKGGVGKSLVSSVLAQYFLNLNIEPKCIDTDPVNQTLTNYKALNVQHLPLLDGSKIDSRRFDQLMERLLTEEGVFVVDNGASTFIPLTSYLVENDAFSMLKEAGRDVYIHCVVTGGQALADTINGFNELASQAKEQNIIVWLNEFFGEIKHEASGKTFTEMNAFLDNQDKVRGVVRVVKRNTDTFGKDMDVMTSRKWTFNEAIENPEFNIMAKQRIKTIQKDLFSQLDEIGF